MLTGIANIQNPEIFDGWPSIEDNSDELKLINLVG